MKSKKCYPRNPMIRLAALVLPGFPHVTTVSTFQHIDKMQTTLSMELAYNCLQCMEYKYTWDSSVYSIARNIGRCHSLGECSKLRQPKLTHINFGRYRHKWWFMMNLILHCLHTSTSLVHLNSLNKPLPQTVMEHWQVCVHYYRWASTTANSA